MNDQLFCWVVITIRSDMHVQMSWQFFLQYFRITYVMDWATLVGCLWLELLAIGSVE